MDHEFLACVELPVGSDFYIVTEGLLGTTVRWGDLDPSIEDPELADFEVYVPEPPHTRHHDDCQECKNAFETCQTPGCANSPIEDHLHCASHSLP